MMDFDPIKMPRSSIELIEQGGRGSIPPLKRGEVVEGRVVRAVSPHHVIILIKGEQLVARTPISFDATGVASFRVEQVRPECVLKFLQAKPDHAVIQPFLLRGVEVGEIAYRSLIDIMLPLISSSRNKLLPDMVHAMWRLLGSMSLRADKVADPQFLRSLVDSSGMVWENKLKKLLLTGPDDGKQANALVGNDLKGLALKALGLARPINMMPSEGLARFVNSIEQLQLANLSGLEGRGSFLVMIPMSLGNNRFRFAQLLVGLPGQDRSAKGDGGKAFTISLFLDMTRLGPIRVDASIFERTIRVCFVVCEKKVQSLLNNYFKDLQKQFERHGFSIGQISCRLEERRILEATSLADAMAECESQHISIMI